MNIVAATDGSALSNPSGPAGWAWWVSPTCWAAGGFSQASNNVAELTAVAQLLLATEHVPGLNLTVLCDSQYVINSLTVWSAGWIRRNWMSSKGTPVANRELIEPLVATLATRDVKFVWVRGHDGHPLNEDADRAATAVSAAIGQNVPFRSGPGWNVAATASTAQATANRWKL